MNWTVIALDGTAVLLLYVAGCAANWHAAEAHTTEPTAGPVKELPPPAPVPAAPRAEEPEQWLAAASAAAEIRSLCGFPRSESPDPGRHRKTTTVVSG